MPFSVAGPSVAAYPQTGQGKTRAEAIAYIAAYIGGENDDDAKQKAGRALDAAVDRYNLADWKFKRKVHSHTLTTGVAGKLVSLPSLFKSPYRARLLDASGNEQGDVAWYEYGVFKDRFSLYTGTGNRPLHYSARNIHETGQVMFEPQLASPIQYPTLEVTYHEWITKTTTDTARLNVPGAVEAAMLEYAVAKAVAMEDGAREAAAQMAEAERLFDLLEDERSYPDY